MSITRHANQHPSPAWRNPISRSWRINSSPNCGTPTPAPCFSRANLDASVLLTTFSDTLADALRTKLRRLAKMNLAIRGADNSQIKWNNEGSFLNDSHKDFKSRLRHCQSSVQLQRLERRRAENRRQMEIWNTTNRQCKLCLDTAPSLSPQPERTNRICSSKWFIKTGINTIFNTGTVCRCLFEYFRWRISAKIYTLIFLGCTARVCRTQVR